MAAGASAALLPTLLAIAANALLILRALAIPNMMFLTAVRFVHDAADLPFSGKC
jgi:hypothetical protein